jgi:hypothetical protein
MRNVASRKVNRLSTATTRGVDAETVTANRARSALGDGCVEACITAMARKILDR